MVKKTRKSLIHLKSSVSGKIPTAEQLNYGEIAINYAKDSEAIFFKNSENNVVEVKTNSAVVEELNTKQDKTDNALATTAKTVTGAINEINTKVSNIPTVNDPKVSIKMNGVEKGSFTLNQASVGEVDLGTVLTEHQSLKTINGETITGSGDISVKGDTVKCRIDQSTMVSDGDGTQENPYVFKMSLEDVKKYKDCDFVEIYDSSSNTSVYSFYRTMTGTFYTPFNVYAGCLAGAFIGDETSTAEQIGFAFYSLHISDEVESGDTALVSSRAVYYALQTKQDKLTSGTNIKTIDGESLIGSGDIKIKNNDYYLPVSAFSGQTAVTQDVLDAIADVRDSQGKKHLYIYDEEAAVGAVAEASVANFFGKLSYYVSWMSYYGDNYNTIWAYQIYSGSKEIKDVSFRFSSFEGSTASASGKQGMVPAPTTADTESFLCGNGKWEKVSGGSSAFNVGPLVYNSTISGKITEANYNALKQHIQNGDALYYAHSDESETWTSNVSATIVSGGTTAETICLFLDDSMSVSGWDPSEALSSFYTTYTANMGMIYQIKKSDLSAGLGGYIYHQPMLSNGVNITKINGQDLILNTPDMNGEANLEISGTFPLDPNNFKFSELVEATLSYKTIVLKNFLYFSHLQSLVAMPLTANGAEATTVSDTKFVYCTFMNLNPGDNKPDASTFGIKFTGDNKWEEVPNTSGQLMYNSDYKVDTSMSDTSTNPVQNKVIKAYIDELVGNLAAQLAQI